MRMICGRDLSQWLQGRPRQIALAIGARAVLRSLPVAATLLPEDRSKESFSIGADLAELFRCLSFAPVAVSPDHLLEQFSAAATVAADIVFAHEAVAAYTTDITKADSYGYHVATPVYFAAATFAAGIGEKTAALERRTFM